MNISGLRAFSPKRRRVLAPMRREHWSKHHEGLDVLSCPMSRTQLTNDQNEPVRVLIVEDDLLVATEMETTLTEAGAMVVAVARSADEALKRSEAYRPTLALIDVELPGLMDGIELAVELAEKFGIRSVFVTGHSDPESVVRAAPAKPLSWIKKPFGPGSIVAAVKLAIRQ